MFSSAVFCSWWYVHELISTSWSAVPTNASRVFRLRFYDHRKIRTVTLRRLFPSALTGVFTTNGRRWKKDMANGGLLFHHPPCSKSLRAEHAELEEEGGNSAAARDIAKTRRRIGQGMRALGFKTLLPDEFQSPGRAPSFFIRKQVRILIVSTPNWKKGFVIYTGKISQADVSASATSEMYILKFARLIKVIQQTSAY